MISKDKVDALKSKMTCEAYECGRYGKVIHKYRITICKYTKKYVAQLFTDGDWLCLHN